AGVRVLAAELALLPASRAALRQFLRGLRFAVDDREQSQVAVRDPGVGESRPDRVPRAPRYRRRQEADGTLAVLEGVRVVCVVVRSHGDPPFQDCEIQRVSERALAFACPMTCRCMMTCMNRESQVDRIDAALAELRR